MENRVNPASDTPQSSHEFRRFICTCCGYSFDAPVSCGNRFCNTCNGPRRRRIISKLQAITSQCKRKDGYAIKHITFTIPNCRTVAQGVQNLVPPFRRVRQRQLWNTRVLGGAYVIEVTGRPSYWHVHLHVLCQARYIPQAKLSRLAEHCGLGRIVWIRNIPLKTGIFYLTKYLSKSEVKPEYQFEMNQGLANTRLFQCFGTWHDFDLKVKKVLSECPKCGETMWLPMDLLDYQSHQLRSSGTTWKRHRAPPTTSADDNYTPPEWIKTSVSTGS